MHRVFAHVLRVYAHVRRVCSAYTRVCSAYMRAAHALHMRTYALHMCISALHARYTCAHTRCIRVYIHYIRSNCYTGAAYAHMATISVYMLYICADKRYARTYTSYTGAYPLDACMYANTAHIARYALHGRTSLHKRVSMLHTRIMRASRGEGGLPSVWGRGSSLRTWARSMAARARCTGCTGCTGNTDRLARAAARDEYSSSSPAAADGRDKGRNNGCASTVGHWLEHTTKACDCDGSTIIIFTKPAPKGDQADSARIVKTLKEVIEKVEERPRRAP
jgi:hypothetical protein